MNDTVTHISGLAITINGRIIQRCAVCGEKLCDSKGSAAPVNEDGSVPSYPIWEENRLIRVSVGCNPTRYGLLPKDQHLPKDSCIDLVE